MKSMYCHGCRGRPTVRLALPKLFLRTNSSTTSASQTTNYTDYFDITSKYNPNLEEMTFARLWIAATNGSGLASARLPGIGFSLPWG